MNQNLKTLVEKRKNCTACGADKVCNVSSFMGGKFDSAEHLTPWSRWQSNPEPLLLVVGQDWSAQDSLMELSREKADSIARFGADITIPTNKNLRTLLASVGMDPGSPDAPLPARLFFYNMVLCLKSGNLASGVEKKISSNCSARFFPDVVHILRPKAIVCLGTLAFKEACRALGVLKSPKLGDHLRAGEHIILPQHGTALFGMYHCGGLGTAQRKLEIQKNDWRRVREFLERNG
jgi:uracil-DNA glycosylase